jgi:hypothetical protein
MAASRKPGTNRHKGLLADAAADYGWTAPPNFEFGGVFVVQLAADSSIFFARGYFAVLLGVLKKLGVLAWCFGGEVVVFCVVDVVF